ncbi:MORN repeat-containing protein [Bradyrhizobium erythrophlei]|nr:hypothetical protein [Bradyrhizobium erythrophlei]
MLTLRALAFPTTVGVYLLLSFSQVFADGASLLAEGEVVETVLSDAMPNEAGKWVTKVQQIFNSDLQRIERREYEYFDPIPSRQLDVTWYPKVFKLDKAGRITGVGRLVWRERSSLVWDPNGIVGIFDGEMRQGRPNGQGEWISNAGLVYDGAWKDGRPNGYGRLKLPSGEEYTGELANGKAEGKGRVFDVTGEVFEGTFSGGLRHGRGTSYLPSGFSYNSIWARGVEEPLSRRVRLAQLGSSGLGSEDFRFGVTVQEKPRLRGTVADPETFVTYHASVGKEVKVEPANKDLMAIWKGNGEIQTEPGDEFRDGLIGFNKKYIDSLPPTFVLEFQNRSSSPIEIRSLKLDVAESRTDLQPAIQMMVSGDYICQGDTFSAMYKLQNFGWSPARGAELHFSFISPDQKSVPQPQVTKPIGDFAGNKEVNLESELAQAHVNVARLKQLAKRGIPCPSGSLNACLENARSNPLFGTLGPKLGLNQSQIVVNAAGSLQYSWVDSQGKEHNRSSPFRVAVGLGKIVEQTECGEGPAIQPVKVDSTKLDLDKTNYTIPIQFERKIEAKKMARFTLPLDAVKSSEHSFRIIANLSDGREITSLPIRLLYYRPKPLAEN